MTQGDQIYVELQQNYRDLSGGHALSSFLCHRKKKALLKENNEGLQGGWSISYMYAALFPS